MAIVEVIPSADPERRRFEVRNPATLEVVGAFDAANTADVATAVARARAAQPAWDALGYNGRGRFVQRALDVLLAKAESYVDTICSETGRSRLETLFVDVFPACDALNFFSRRAAKILRPRRVGLHLLKMKRATIAYRPLGVVGVISPWNGPFILALNPAVQALMAGNTVVVKPSEVTPFTGRLVEDLFREAGLPDGVVQVLLGDGETGEALVDGGVDKIAFTGSVATGRKIGEACGRNLVPCTLELGGKDALIVCADADLERAAGGAVFGGFMNNGQFCCGTERVYVVESVADAFLEKVVEKTRALRHGTEGEFDLGPFIFERQLEVVESHVRDAVAAGAKVLVGGKRAEGVGAYFYEPTVMVDVTEDMALMRDETFGPVLAVVRCADEAEAVRRANESRYGLSGSVWTRDKGRGERLARQMDTGSVCVNDTGIVYGALELPFGGRKDSGLHQVNGAEGLKGYCHAQPVLIDRFGPARELVWYPYTQHTYQTLKKTLGWLWGSRLMRWLLG